MRLAPFMIGGMLTLFVFECVTSKGVILDYARMEFNAHTPPSVTKDKPNATNKVSMSDYRKFAQVCSLFLMLIISSVILT